MKRMLLVLCALALCRLAQGGAFTGAAFCGEAAALHPVRLSAYPQNQVWPGYQRPRHQTKRGWFVNFDVAAPGDFALAFDTPAAAEAARRALRIRPLSRTNEVCVAASNLLVRVDGPEQFLMEFPGFAEDLHVFANPPFAYTHVPDEIYFGPGIHDAGMIRPKSGTTVCFAPGAYVYGCLFLDAVKDVKIVGRGVLDSSRMVRTVGDGRVLDNQLANIRTGKGPWHLNSSSFTALATTNLTVEGVTLVDAPFWAVILRDCERTAFDNLKIVGQWRYNADGIDVCYSRDTTIRNCFIRSFDDCIVARGAQLTRHGEPLANLLAENCVLWCDWGKNLEIWGGDCVGDIRNVVYRSCKCIEVSHIACDLHVQGGAARVNVEHVRFEDIEVDLVPPRPASQLQRKEDPDEPYRGGEVTSCNLFIADAAPRDASVRIAFDDIVCRNLRVYGARQDLVVRIDESPAALSVANLVLESLPPGTKIHRRK